MQTKRCRCYCYNGNERCTLCTFIVDVTVFNFIITIIFTLIADKSIVQSKGLTMHLEWCWVNASFSLFCIYKTKRVAMIWLAAISVTINPYLPSNFEWVRMLRHHLLCKTNVPTSLYFII